MKYFVYLALIGVASSRYLQDVATTTTVDEGAVVDPDTTTVVPETPAEDPAVDEEAPEEDGDTSDEKPFKKRFKGKGKGKK